MYLELSHRLGVNTPRPPGVPPPEFRHECSIARGDVSNMFVLQFSNHTGTHIDAPWHFVATGLGICDFSLDEFVFERPLCLDLTLEDSEMFRPPHFEPHAESIARCDLLLLRTGYTLVRQRDPARYRQHSPGMSIEGADYFAQQFPSLRALGMDTVSLACIDHLDEGMEAHRILLGGAGRRFLVIEDMNLNYDLSRLRRVLALPLFLEGVDSSPCTVMGICD